MNEHMDLDDIFDEKPHDKCGIFGADVYKRQVSVLQLLMSTDSTLRRMQPLKEDSSL